MEVRDMASPSSRAGRSFTKNPTPEDFTDVHIHGQYELFCVTSGDIEYHVEGTAYCPASGDIFLTKPAEAHSVKILSDSPYERVYVQFNEEMLIGDLKSELVQFLNDRPLGQGNHFPCTSLGGHNWQYYIEKINTTISRAKRQLYISLLVSELYEARQDAVHVPPARGVGEISDIVNYISTHLTMPLSVDMLCNRFYISRAQLNRKFQKYTSCSVWEYIISKRLLLAKSLLQSGVNPAVACTESGFNNYTSFYRAYRKRFGVSPQADQYKQ
jgi:AraC-like DNA-binding protein